MITANLYHISIPMNQSFNHAQSDRHFAESVILHLHYKGANGIGECVPRSYVTGETIHSVIDTITKININSLLSSLDLSNLHNAINSLNKILYTDTIIHNQQQLNAICLLDMALFDLIGNIFNCSIKDILKQFYIPIAIQCSQTLEQIPTSQVMDFSLTPEEFINNRGPFHTVKIKLGNNIEGNIQRVKNVRERLNIDVPLIIDANMIWQYDEAVKNILSLKPYNITYYEEPLAKHSWQNYRKLREEMGIKILLDESLCSITDAHMAIKNKSCDAFNIRISKCGGFIRSAKILQIASLNNVSYQIGAQVAETGPLIAAGRQLVSAITNNLTFEAGQADRHFNHSIISPTPLINRTTNTAAVLTGPGLGVSLNYNFLSYVERAISWKEQWIYIY